MLVQVIFYGAIGILLEMLTWGTLGFFIFRVFRISSYLWYLECIILSILFFLAELMSNKFLSALEISIGNKEVLEILDNDWDSLFVTDFYTAAFVVVEVFIGYKFGEYLFGKIRKRLAAV